MHKKNFVAAVKVDGKVLRESSDRVQLPFGAEYSLLLKNLDSVRMQAQITIDGKEVGGWLVINPNEQIEVERFFNESNYKGHKFKFIERTAGVEQHRGVQAEDGLVRIEFKKEKYVQPIVYQTYNHNFQLNNAQPIFFDKTLRPTLTASGGLRGMSVNSSGMRSGVGGSSVASNSVSDMYKYSQGQNQNAAFAGASAFDPADVSMACFAQGMQQVQNDAGITVEGSISDQRFQSVAGFECEASEVIVLHLIGKGVVQPKTVDIKPTCHTCGMKNRPQNKFCFYCGTNLEKFKMRPHGVF